jgi:hypothetical protein
MTEKRKTRVRLALLCGALAPFGYRIESRFDPERNRTSYDVYREGKDEPLLAGLASRCHLGRTEMC